MSDALEAPPIGIRIVQRSNSYELRGMRAHTRLDGNKTLLLRWVSDCYSCGSKFEVWAPVSGSEYMNRRCKACAQPGQWTKKRRKNK